MIGILIVTHGNFGLELLKSAELIIGKQENVETISFNQGDNIEALYNKVNKSVKKIRQRRRSISFYRFIWRESF